jgi:hypothetical protein
MPMRDALQMPVGVRDKGERLKIEWRGDWPKEAKPAVVALVREVSFIVPPWCQSLCVDWGAAEREGSNAETETNVPYRWAFVRICPPFLTESPTERRRIIIHELCHVLTAPAFEAACAVLDELVKEHAPEAYEYAKAQLVSGNEAAVCDMTAMIMRKLDGGKR